MYIICDLFEKELYNAFIHTNKPKRNDAYINSIDIDKALNYIWNTLGSPAQQKLSAVAVINGVNNPKQFILDMLQAGTDESISVTTDIIKQPKSAEAEAKEKLSPVSKPSCAKKKVAQYDKNGNLIATYESYKGCKWYFICNKQNM